MGGYSEILGGSCAGLFRKWEPGVEVEVGARDGGDGEERREVGAKEGLEL